MTSLLTISMLVAVLGVAPDSAAPDLTSTSPAAAPAPNPETAGEASPEGAPATEGPPTNEDELDTLDGEFESTTGSTTESADEDRSSSAPPSTQPSTSPATSTATSTAPIEPPPPPRTIRWRLDLGLGVGGTMVSDRGILAFAKRQHLPAAAASVLFDVRLAGGHVFLGGGLAYQRLGRSGGDAYGQLINDLVMHEPELRGRISVMTLEGLDVFARFGAGPSLVGLEFTSTDSASQRAVLPRVDGQAGLSLYLPRPWLARKRASRVTAGLDIGLGYTWRGTLAVKPDPSQSEQPLRATSSPFGDLSMRGLSWRVGLFVRVM
ncbi:MAG: hypothetical protein AAGF11_32310 [Myxococcota bacterium]